jgi:hypothetical protein
MNNSSGVREGWHTQHRPDREAILRELQEILASPHFCNSKRYPALLQYIVENTLAGKTELLKERTIGVDVFERPPTYDTSADTVVRYTAGEVRKRLLLYYSDTGVKSGLRIALPAGSYIPEFLEGHDPDIASPHSTHTLESSAEDSDGKGISSASPFTNAHKTDLSGGGADAGQSTAMALRRLFVKPVAWMALAAFAAIVFAAGWQWQNRTNPPRTAADAFWAPLMRDQHTVLVCTGSVIFAQNNSSGVHTAGKDIDYPFISLQNASAIALTSARIEHSGATSQLLASASVPLTELREHSVVLIGGYNNLWTLRLLQPLRFHFSPDSPDASDQDAAIVDRNQPQQHWQRDHSLPYSSADDFALLVRYHDPTIDGWVVAVAGLGRNGTEAAAQFANSPHYMQLLRDQLGTDFSNRNIEAVLKVKVIDGKTGAPSILAVHSW